MSSCPNCGTDYDGGARFCGSCGAELQTACSQCGAVHPAHLNFCTECGTRLSTRAPAMRSIVEPTISDRDPSASLRPPPTADPEYPEERKIATILFADLSGFTRLTGRMDPEDVRDTIDECFHLLRQEITRYGGVIDKYIGDEVMALFGVPVTHEKDAHNAVKAALAMHAAIRDFSKTTEADRGFRLAIRVGINTGQVLAGPIGEEQDRSFTVMGHAVNLAARLVDRAPIGGILISHNTYRRVMGAFEVEALGPIQVKGQEKPIRVYRVLEERPRTRISEARGIRGLKTRMIGREAELERLRRVFEQVRQESQAQMVSIVANAGLGKSRLLYEFRRGLRAYQEEVLAVAGRASIYTETIPYFLIRDLLSTWLGIRETDSPTEIHRKLVAGIEQILGTNDPVRAFAVGRLFGFELHGLEPPDPLLNDPQVLQDRGMQYLKELIKAECSRRCLLFYCEDIHWADNQSLDVLEHLAQACWNEPLLIVCLARNDLYDKRPGWGTEPENQMTIQLSPLSPDDSLALVEEILQSVRHLPESFKRRIAEKSDGNPYYIEETIKMFLEKGVIVEIDGEWQVLENKMLEQRIPDTVQEILQARLDGLDPREKAILQRASVVGRIFWEGVLSSLMEEMLEDTLEDILAGLWQKELIFGRDESSFENDREYIFKHDMLREVTYETLLRKVRRKYHLSVAEWIEARSGERIVEYAPLIASHFELAGEYERAVHYYRVAGDAARARHAHRQAIDYYTKALSILRDMPGEQPLRDSFEVLAVREQLWSLVGDRKNQMQDLNRMRRIAEELQDEARRGRLYLIEADYHLLISHYDRAETLARDALDIVRKLKDKKGESLALMHIGNANLFLGQFDKALTYHQQALAIADDQDDGPGRGRHLGDIGRVYLQMGKYIDALASLHEALAWQQEATDRRGEAKTLGNIGLVYTNLGDHANALASFQHALQIDRQMGDRINEARHLGNIGLAYTHLGEYENALTYYIEALKIKREIRDKYGEAEDLGKMGLVYYYLGDYENAEKYQLDALSIRREIQDVPGQCSHLIDLGLVRRELGDYAGADRYLRAASRLANKSRAKGERALALIHLASVYRRTRLLDKTASTLQEAELVAEGLGSRGVHLYLVMERALLSVARGELEAALADLQRAVTLAQDTLSVSGEARALSHSAVCLMHLGRVQEALEKSTAAVRLVLERPRFDVGVAKMVWYHNYLVQKQARAARPKKLKLDPESALERARSLVHSTLERLADETLRENFRKEPLVREILSANKHG